ncbi:zinc finger protein 507 [Kryptolebias marmoratus]|uniref:Zinc finger protein 507 n=1 Tax=Kryptolebias marmoratus TaxID=37003 RepID=A0A3Q3API2_KRYMA|nr:zinc finger protein 507 [Kryptolebias marmoratus]XP_017275136.1 zinc finger protein 507 [Kryptolebias marmoratus]XP_017275137.1 zinc finger protein 507 [Kryptolebias marmoratus]
MDESSSVAVLLTKSSTASSSSSVLRAHCQTQTRTQPSIGQDIPASIQQKQADDSLIQVIEKLSKIVEKRPQRRCTPGVQKRALRPTSSAKGKGGEEGLSCGGSHYKKVRKGCIEEASKVDVPLSLPVSGDDNNNSITSTLTEVTDSLTSTDHKWTVTCYQCSLCPYLSQTLPQLREHLKQHNEQHSDLILMCSECHFSSRDQAQLEAHVRLHFDDGGNTNSVNSDPLAKGEGDILKKEEEDTDSCEVRCKALKSSADCSKEIPQKKKWYSYEKYGLYRCLICSYVCSQQRMLKTHAWKHAGLVDCSYPIFEEEEGASTRREAQAAANSVTLREDLVVLSPVLQEKSQQTLPSAFKLQFCMPVTVENKQDAFSHPVSDPNESQKTAEEEEEEESGYSVKDVSSEEPMVEVQVTTEADIDVDISACRESSSVTDSLLSSAQKIINSSPNSAGHINVIVERLPSAEDSVMVTKPLLLGSDEDRDKSLLDVKEEEEEEEEQQQQQQDPLRSVKEEVVLGCSPDNSANSQMLEGDNMSSVGKDNDPPRDENIPPASRKRTHSESLRLHSLAAEVLVAMPMRTPELHVSSTKVNLKTISPQVQSPHTGQRLLEVSTGGQKASDIGTTAALLDLELRSEGREGDLKALGIGEGDEGSPTAKAGISLSLLTVIERLRERSDQNASDEDILKELQDNAQFQNGAADGAVTGTGAESYMCTISGMEGLVSSADGSLVDYIPGSERPYRCRLCQYSSSNKGYIKQHLRVHKQRVPYQCPICEHKASDSKDLENHMIYHCKTKMYQCKQCTEAFHYKSQLRSHEREQHSFCNDITSLTAGTEAITAAEESEQGTDEDCSQRKVYKCDVCNYTSATYVGVRNHRRIHNSDKPYRCCGCDFATTNMNSLKSHMRRHPQEHQAVQLLEQYRCSLCGYVCSHPPSLKSHMWKHAGDQNYNYEQVNKAINEAISQSSRAPQKLSAVLESVAESPVMVPRSNDKAKVPVEPVSMPRPAIKAGVFLDSTAGLPTPPTDSSQWPSEIQTPQDKDPSQPQSQNQLHTGQFPAPGANMEYCVLLFCCCICGFESTSKERLMDHMKEHEGDIISIILNKEQQQQQQQQPETHQSLQTAE